MQPCSVQAVLIVSAPLSAQCRCWWPLSASEESVHPPCALACSGSMVLLLHWPAIPLRELEGFTLMTEIHSIA